jgi:multidrug efflux pump
MKSRFPDGRCEPEIYQAGAQDTYKPGKSCSYGSINPEYRTNTSACLSGQRFGYFFMNGKQYQILGEMQRDPKEINPLDLKSLYVRSNSGEMIQLDNLVTLEEETAPPQLYRYNRFVSATVTAGLSDGWTIGQGLAGNGQDCR